MKNPRLPAWLGSLALLGPLSAATVFEATFESAAAGDVTSAGDLAPETGSFTFSGTAFGQISANSGQAFTTANDISNAVSGAGSITADAGTGELLTANFAAAGTFSGAATTAISLDLGCYGTSSDQNFKAMIIRGLSSTSDEVFEVWVTFGSQNGTREVFARGSGDTTYTRDATNADNLNFSSGTMIYQGIAGTWNGTDATTRPGLHTMTISLANDQVTYGLSNGTDQGTLTFGLNSAATDIARLEFTQIEHDTVSGQNKGYWIDNLVVTTAVPEPGIALLGGFGLLGLLRRRR